MPSLLQPTPEKINELHRSVEIFNVSDQDFKVKYNKAIYRCRPRHAIRVQAYVAYHVFGDPSELRHEDPRRRAIEIRRIRDLYGRSQDRFFDTYIKSGLIFCAEMGTRERDYYKAPEPKGRTYYDGTPIGDQQLERILSGAPLPAGQSVEREMSDAELQALTMQFGAASKHAGARESLTSESVRAAIADTPTGADQATLDALANSVMGVVA